MLTAYSIIFLQMAAIEIGAFILSLNEGMSTGLEEVCVKRLLHFYSNNLICVETFSKSVILGYYLLWRLFSADALGRTNAYWNVTKFAPN